MNSKNKKLTFEIIASIVVLLINSCVILPIYSNLASDIFSSNILLLIVDILSAILDVSLISLLISIIATGTYLKINDKFKALYYLISCAIIVSKHAADILVSGISNGFASIGSFDFVSVLITCVFYIIILTIAFLFVKDKLNSFFEESEKLSKAYKTAYGTEYDPSSAIYPFNKFIDFKNPILYGTFWSSIAYLAIKIGSRIYYDIQFGAPEDFAEVFEIIIGYTGDIIESLLVYTFVYFLASFVLKKKGFYNKCWGKPAVRIKK